MNRFRIVAGVIVGLLVVLALASRAHDAAPPETTAVDDEGRELTTLPLRGSGHVGPRVFAPPTRSDTPASTAEATERRRRPRARLHAHLLDPCVDPVDPNPPVPDGYAVETFDARIRIAAAPDTLDLERTVQIVDWVAEGIELAAAVTDTEPRERVTVVVYDSVATLRERHELPEWVHGIYDGAIRIGADGPHPRPVLRHEATHAQLHIAVGCIPTWLNEGLAKYVQGFAGDVIEPWLGQVERREALPFDVLGSSTLVDVPEGEDVAVHYAQSLAMVLWLEKKVGIPDAIDRLQRDHIQPDRLWPALMPTQTDDDYLGFLVDHLELPTDGGSCRFFVRDVDTIRCLSEDQLPPEL